MNWNILIGMTLVLASIGGAVAQSDGTDDYDYDDPSTASYDADPNTDAADDADDADDAPPGFRNVHQCVHKVDTAFHHAQHYGKHIKQQMRAIEHRVTMLELKEMRISNALEHIEPGEPINETQQEKLEKILARAEAALEQEPGPRKEAYLLQVINRTQAALDAGVWTEEDVEDLEKQLERIQKMQDKLLRKYVALKHKMGDLRDRFTDFVQDRPCIDAAGDKPDKHERPDKPDRKASDVRSYEGRDKPSSSGDSAA